MKESISSNKSDYKLKIAYEALERVKKGFIPTPDERKLISMITTLKVWSDHAKM